MKAKHLLSAIPLLVSLLAPQHHVSASRTVGGIIRNRSSYYLTNVTITPSSGSTIVTAPSTSIPPGDSTAWSAYETASGIDYTIDYYRNGAPISSNSYGSIPYYSVLYIYYDSRPMSGGTTFTGWCDCP